MKTQTLRSNLMLLLAAAIWGFAFVAQRIGIKYVGPFTFNGVRFALGSLSLVPLIFIYGSKSHIKENKRSEQKMNYMRACLQGWCFLPVHPYSKSDWYIPLPEKLLL